MADVLLVLGVLVVGALASTLVAVALAVRAVRRRARVTPRVSTGAPLWWACSPSPLARLHRRLRAAVLSARGACPPVGRRRPRTTLHELADDVEELAIALDLRLVAAARAGRALRHEPLRILASEVTQIEDLSRRVVAHARIGMAPSGTSVAALDQRLRALEAAQREVDALDDLRRLA